MSDLQPSDQLLKEQQRLLYRNSLLPIFVSLVIGLLLEYLHQEVARSVRHHQHGALLCLDLDNFNTVNDALGHSAGDNLRCQVADRLTDCLREEDTAARMGGDEFTILLSHLDPAIDQAARQVEDVIRRVTKSLAMPFFIAAQQLTISFSMGISLFPEADKRPEDILKQADTALNQAKGAGQGTFRFYQPEMQGAADRRLRLHGAEVQLTTTEFSILSRLAEKTGWVFTRQQIIDHARGYDFLITPRAVDVQIFGLRKKFGDCGRMIETVRGIGYRFRSTLEEKV